LNNRLFTAQSFDSKGTNQHGESLRKTKKKNDAQRGGGTRELNHAQKEQKTNEYGEHLGEKHRKDEGKGGSIKREKQTQRHGSAELSEQRT